MAAHFLTINGETRIISNTMSIITAGFHPAKSYYNHRGDTLSYFVDNYGHVISRISARRRQPVLGFYNTTKEANEAFKRMNAGQTFQTGRWVPEKRRS
jgi:hypothetical protein